MFWSRAKEERKTNIAKGEHTHRERLREKEEFGSETKEESLTAKCSVIHICGSTMFALTSLLSILCVVVMPSATFGILDADSETDCHNQFGRWVTVTMKDAGVPANGWEGNYLHFQDDELQDIVKFTLADGLNSGQESFCLDHYDTDFSKCYTIYMDDEGYNPQQVSWIVKITTRNNGATWRTSDGIDQWVSGNENSGHGWNPVTGKMEAVKQGGSPADVKILCGRLFKKLGRYSMKQIDKVGIDQMSNEDNMLYKSQSALAKIEAHAQLLNLYVADSDQPLSVDKDDWFIGEPTTTTANAGVTTTTTTTTTISEDCADCAAGCTGCAVKSWQGDGQCDDDNNNCGCNWDGGDCCSSDASTLYCTDCSCLDPTQ